MLWYGNRPQLEELTEVDQDVIIQTSFDDYGKMQAILDEKKWVVNNSELQRVPVDTTTLDLENAQKYRKITSFSYMYSEIPLVFQFWSMANDLRSH